MSRRFEIEVKKRRIPRLRTAALVVGGILLVRKFSPEVHRYLRMERM